MRTWPAAAIIVLLIGGPSVFAEEPIPAEAAARIQQATARVTAVLNNPDAPDAQQRYREAKAEFRAAMRAAAQTTRSAAARTQLFNSEMMLEKHFDDQARRMLDNAAAPAAPAQTEAQPQPIAPAAELLTAPTQPAHVADVGVSERGLVFVCGQSIDGVNLPCREIQEDGRQCRAVIVTDGDVVSRDSITTECFKMDLEKRDAFLATQPKDRQTTPHDEPFAADGDDTAAEIQRLLRQPEGLDPTVEDVLVTVLQRIMAVKKAAEAAHRSAPATGDQTTLNRTPNQNAGALAQGSPKPAPPSAPSTITGKQFGDVAGNSTGAQAGNLGAAPSSPTVAFAVPPPQAPAAPTIHDSTGASVRTPAVTTPTVTAHTPVARTPDVPVTAPVVRTPDLQVHTPVVETPNATSINTPQVHTPATAVRTPTTTTPSISADAKCQSLIGNYITAAQAQDGPAAQAAYESLSAVGGCGVLAQAEAQAKAQAPAQDASADPRFVARGDTPLLDQIVAQCDRQAAACAEVVRQLRAGTSSAAVAALYANAISIGLQVGAIAGQGVLSASHAGAVRAPSSNTSSNMNSIGNRPVSSTYGQGGPLRPAPPSGQSTITFPGQ
jgi:hypothetical protein